ncbi:MAG: succinate dehydrogenase, hydrophobic membrane anchor protein [Hyphomonadaceae bacterium]|nr:succinate dehydrogenase, hydrophobic membrane anchor protein [Hyphomonadaceae bacterium]MBX3510961.1 succinate dehydrogenase, hydrophobic membrane anchor protein [Hyphomonadaceae bacterium]
MSAPKNAMRTPLGKVRHHGAGKEGTGHFIATRATSVALALLLPWFIVTAALSLRTGYLGAIDFLTTPVNAVGVILLVAIGFYHMSLGMQEVVLDYIERPLSKALLLLLNAFVPLALGVGAVFAVLIVNFGV